MKIKKNITPKNQPAENIFFYLNILLLFIIALAFSGTLLLNVNFLQKHLSKTLYFTSNSVKSILKVFHTLSFSPINPEKYTASSPKLTIQINQNPNSKNAKENFSLNYFEMGEKMIFGGSLAHSTLRNSLAGTHSTNHSFIFSGRNIKNVFLIVMENENWSSILGNVNDAPYINQAILPQASYTENYFNPVHVHPSEPNYIWLEAGSNFNLNGKNFLTDEDPSEFNSTDTKNHLVSILSENNISWKTYLEDVDGNSCPLSTNGLYAAKHNPTVFFQDITTDKIFCVKHERPLEEMFKDLKSNNIPQYNLIIPNLCDDMHDSCAPINNNIRQGDKWLSVVTPKILSSEAYLQGGLILIVWDEGEQSSDGPIGLIALSPFVKGSGYVDDTYYTHSSLLKTVEEIFELPLLRDSKTANDLSNLFITQSSDTSLSVYPRNFFVFPTPETP